MPWERLLPPLVHVFQHLIQFLLPVLRLPVCGRVLGQELSRRCIPAIRVIDIFWQDNGPSKYLLIDMDLVLGQLVL